MPIEMRVDAERRLVLGSVVGDFTIAEILEAITSSVEHPDFEPGFDILTDHTAVGRPLTREQVERTTIHLRALAKSLGGARWAVVTKKSASRGMIHMLAVHAEEVPMEIRAFDSMADAEVWLSSSRS